MSIRALKALVATMGVLLVAGVVVLVVAIALRLSPRPAPLPAAFTAPPLALPKGARIEAIGTGPDRIVVAVELPDGARQLIVLDLRSGRLVGTVPLHEGPETAR
jgi:hypothetical protein